jgi:hypothetical protein
MQRINTVHSEHCNDATYQHCSQRALQRWNVLTLFTASNATMNVSTLFTASTATMERINTVHSEHCNDGKSQTSEQNVGPSGTCEGEGDVIAMYRCASTTRHVDAVRQPHAHRCNVKAD